ncbi:MAG: hypothetical protein Q9M94_06950 [Candidatus Gracilibacteria bacterium]|nr:hypothetical protein [Candidatus Gracilibacteria bacterium]MDQ7022718.1 hypothetical protein [Candidatus Gracilibacteria bacterium]
MRGKLVKLIPVVGKIFDHIKGDNVVFSKYGNPELDKLGINQQVQQMGSSALTVNPPFIKNKGMITLNVNRFIVNGGLDKITLVTLMLEEGWHLKNPENKDYNMAKGYPKLIKNEKYIKNHIISEINSGLFSQNIQKVLYEKSIPDIKNKKDKKIIFDFIEKVINIELVPNIGKTNSEVKKIYFINMKSLHPKIKTFEEAIQKGLEDVRL